VATFTWFGGSGSGDVAMNWSPSGPPNTGDTAIVSSGTVQLTDAGLSSNTVLLNAGTFQLTNDTGSFSSDGNLVSAFDQGTTMFAGASAAAEIDTFGDFVNEGLIEATGTADTSTTIKIAQSGTAPGYYLNYGVIEATAGNSITISVAGTSELFNAGLIYADGGTVVINGGTGIAGGYAPMLGGLALVGSGGTLVYDAGFPSGTGGSSPLFAFYNGTTGTTLLLEQLGQFGGRILGFEHGDTIDLGGVLSVGTIVVTSDGQLLLENNSGVVLDTLVLSSGAYNTGTFAVSGGIADGFTLTTGGDGDTLLTTDVVDSVWNNTTGVWQTGTAWSTGAAPGSTATAVVGIAPGGATGAISPFTLNTGDVAVNVDGLIEANSNATLQITSATTVGTSINEYGVQQIAGEIEITGGNTLTGTFFRQASPSTDLQIDAGAVLALTGHSNLGFANNGTLTETTVVNGTVIANGNTEALFVTGMATDDGGTIDAGPVFSGSSVVSTGGYIDIGLNGGGTPSTMTVENGSTVIDTYAALSSDPTSFGALTITGGSVWDDVGDPTDALNTRGFMIVGSDDQSDNQPSPLPAGTAQLVVEDNSVLTEALYGIVGNSVDSAGSATIISGGVWNIGRSAAGGFLNVGNHGSGTLVVGVGGTVNILAGTGTFTENGTLVTTGQGMAIAHYAGADGTVVVDGGVLNLEINNTASASGMGVGQNGQGVLDIYDAGTVSITNGGFSAGSDTITADGTIIVGSGDGQSALLEETSTNPNSNGASIGKTGSGTLIVNADGTVDVGAGAFDVGHTAGSNGLVEINGGLLEATAEGMSLGDSGTGTVFINAGGTMEAGGDPIDVGRFQGSFGFLEVNGGLVRNINSGLNVGDSGTGTLELLNLGTVSVEGGIQVGTSAGGVGTVVVTGGTLISTDAGMNVGNAGDGVLSVNGGGVSVDSGMSVGLSAGVTGFATIANGRLSEGAALVVGNSGDGTLDVGTGGTVSAVNGLSIGNTSTGTGTVIVNGGTLVDGGIFNVGGSGTGTLVVEGGGVVDQTGVGFNVGGGVGTQGVVAVTGGTVAVGSVSDNDGGTITVGGGTVAAVLSSSGQFNIGGLPDSVVVTVGSLGTLTGTGSNFLDVNFFSSLVVNGGLVTNFVNVVLGVPAVEGGDGGTLVVTGGGTLEGAAVSVNDNSLLEADSLTVGGAITDGEIGNLSINAGGTVVVSSITLGTGGLINLNGGVLDPITLSVDGSGMIGGAGTLDTNVRFADGSDSLTYSNNGSTLEIVGSITGAGTLVLGTGSDILLDVAPGGAQSVTFGSGTEALILGAPALNTTAFAAMSVGFGDLIAFGGSIAIDGIASSPGTAGENVTLTVTENASIGTITFDNVSGATHFNLTTYAGDAAIQAACYAAGTRIATPRGEIAVEDLRVGDVVRTVLNGTEAPIVWVGKREVDCANHPKPKQVWPVHVAAGAFGPGQPHTELVLSPDHAAYVNEVLIPVRYLINGSTIRQVPVDSVTYHHVELPQHDVLLAQGLPAESFLDMRNGSNYANRPGPVRLYPDYSTRMWEAFGCARLVVAGAELEAARALVAGFAAERVAA
jgi:hypothetical protein